MLENINRGFIEIAQLAQPGWQVVVQENPDEICIALSNTKVIVSKIFDDYLRGQANDLTEKKVLRLAFSEFRLHVFGDRKLQEIITEIAKSVLEFLEPQSIVNALIDHAVNLENITYDERVTLCIGSSGTGKSTAINYWQGCPMRMVPASDLGLSGDDVIYAENQVAEIGHFAFKSKSKNPQGYRHDGVTFVDCPGFKDSDGGAAEIGNIFAIRKVLEKAMDVRLAVFIACESIMGRGNAREAAKADLRYLQQLLREFEPYKNSILFVITNVGNRNEGSVRNSFQALLEYIKNDGSSLELSNFCKEIYDSQYRLMFCKPMEADSLPQQLSCIRELTPISLGNRNLGYPLSPDAKADLLNHRPSILVRARAAFAALNNRTIARWNDRANQTEDVESLKTMLDEIGSIIRDSSINALIQENQGLRTSVDYCDRIDIINDRGCEAHLELQDKFLQLQEGLQVIADVIGKKFLAALYVETEKACKKSVRSYRIQSTLDGFKQEHAQIIQELDGVEPESLYNFLGQIDVLPYPDYRDYLIGYLQSNRNLQESLKNIIRNNIINPFEINLIQRTHIIAANAQRLALTQTLSSIDEFIKDLREGDCIRINSVSNDFVLYFDRDLLRDQFHGVSLEVQRIGRVKGNHNYTIDLMTNRRVAGYAHLKFGTLQGQSNINNLQLQLAQGEALTNNYSKAWDRICTEFRLKEVPY